MIFITLALMLLLCSLLASDIAIYRLPNRLLAGLVFLYVPYTWLILLPPVDILLALGVMGALMALGMAMFALQMIGGGDAKFIAVCGLWVGFHHLAEYLLYMTLYGGAMTLGLLIVRPIIAKVTADFWPMEKLPLCLQRRAPVPYGVAISASLLTLIALGKIPGLSLT